MHATDDVEQPVTTDPNAQRRHRLPGLRESSWAPAAVVLLLYLVWTASFLASGHDVRELILVGHKFAAQSSASAVIDRTVRADATFPYGPVVGYDGQFAYFIALDPVNASSYIDRPAFRYARIVYPLAARLLAFGQPALVPWTMVLINLLALAGGTWALAAWLRRRGASPWLALVYGLYSGLFIAFQRDLTEPLAYGLVALATYLFDFGGSRRVIWAGVCFALALLTRETVVVFLAVYALALLFEGGRAGGWQTRMRSHWRPTLAFLTIAVGPYLAYRAFLLAWLGAVGIRTDLVPQLVPFGGILALWPWNDEQWRTVVVVTVPALICAALGIWALWTRNLAVEVWALLANVLLFVVLLPTPDYVDFGGTGRITAGVVLGAALCAPAFSRLGHRSRWWTAICAPLWLYVTVIGYVPTLASAFGRL
ncbi:MAG TPA: hypothetical protein VGS80_27585 [Ktedonobacterales bacterium]|nr:hypothetical protein [Ktedonobacterales bacterium]